MYWVLYVERALAFNQGQRDEENGINNRRYTPRAKLTGSFQHTYTATLHLKVLITHRVVPQVLMVPVYTLPTVCERWNRRRITQWIVLYEMGCLSPLPVVFVAS